MKRFINIESTLAFWDYQISDKRSKTQKVLTQSCTEDWKLQIETLNQEIKSAIMENYELEYRENVKTNGGSLAFLNYQNFTAINEDKFSKTIIFLQLAVCPMRP